MTTPIRMPLGDNQMGIYLECIRNENALPYNIVFSYRFAPEIDAVRLKNACDKVLAHYSAFSAGIATEDGRPVFVFGENAPVTCTLHQIAESEYNGIRDSYSKAFRFDGSPLCRADLYQTEVGLGLMVCVHHLVYDGTSTVVFDHAVERAYRGEELEPETVPYYDAIREESEWEKDGGLAGSYDYFDQLLGGVETDSNLLPDLDLPDDGKCRMLHLPLGVSPADVKTFASGLGVSENVVLLAAFSYALAKYTGQNEALFASVEHGRRGRALANTVGYFVRTFPLYFRIDEESDVADFILGIKRTYTDTMKNDHVSFSSLAERHGIRPDIQYVYQGELINGFEFAGTPADKRLIDNEDAQSNLAAMIIRTEDDYLLRLDYLPARYSEANIRQFASFYKNVAAGMLVSKRLKDLPLVSDDDRRLLDRRNVTELPYDREASVWDILSERIEKTPDRGAVWADGHIRTYAEIGRLTGNLAAYLAAKGIGHEDFVAVMTGRNEWMSVAALGAVRAGAAYQPLDPAYPAERLNFMVRDAGAKLLIADRSLREILDGYTGDVLYTDEIESLPDTPSAPCEDTPESALVIVYTSGTTGTPKGSVLENRNIVCFYHNHRSVMGLSEDCRVAAYASFGFDAGIMDLFTTLMAGGTLYIIPDEIRLEIGALDSFYREHGITHGFFTTQVGRMFAESTGCRTLRKLMIGGEKLVPFDPPAGFDVINGYGPSETIAYVCHHTVCDASVIQPVGMPSGNTKIYVVDPYLRLLPPGACGELCIAGGQVGRGYLGRPEKTSEVFVKNPFSDDAYYGRIYRTGDVVRMLPSGEIDFVGRRDGQVKIRGYRVELTEVEQVIREYPSVSDATVQAFDAPGGGKFLAAYTVTDTPLDPDALCAFLLARKPEYMVPDTFTPLDAIPRNPNGKVDRRKLPVPEKRFTDLTPPENETQKRIFEIAADVLGSREFGIRTDLFAAGLSSISVMRLNARLADEFGVSLTVRDLRRNDTVEKLENAIGALCEDDKPAETSDHPLTKNQEGIYVECIRDPESTVYNIPLLLKLGRGIDPVRLKHAIADAVNAHRYLLNRLSTDPNGEVRQIPWTGAAFAPDAIEDTEAEKIDDLLPALTKPFTLLGGPLFRVQLIRADALYLFFDIHHIIGDGTSIRILLDDIGRAYAGEPVAPETFTGYDAAEAEKAARTGTELTLAKSYFEKVFGDADADFLPNGDRLPETPVSDGSFSAPARHATVSGTENFCKSHRLSVNSLMLSAFGFVLAKWNCEAYSVFTTVYNGRTDSRAEHTFAMLTKTLPVRVDLEQADSASLVQATFDQFVDSIANDSFSFAEISRAFGIRSDIMFIYQGSDFGFDSFCGEDAEEIGIELSDKKAPLSLQVYLTKDGFRYVADYDSDRFTEAFVRSLVNAFDTVLAQMASDTALPQIRLTDEETERELDAMNETDAPYEESRTMTAWFEQTAKLHPEKTAVYADGRTYSYAQVEDLSARIAACLKRRGIGKGQFVPVLVGRNEYMAIATYGVLRAGAGYEPLDPTYPEERLSYMVHNADATVLIADREFETLAKALSDDVIFTDEIASLPEAPGFVSDTQPDDLFVIIYTSGTTGVPKGNMLSHRQPVCLFTYHLKDAGIGPDANVAYYTGFSFDAGMLDLHAALVSGATLYVIPESIRLDLAALDRFYCEHGITHGSMTTQMGSLFCKMTTCPTLRNLQAGGEKLTPFIPPAHVRYDNAYGPSECTVYASRYTVKNDAPLQPIGKPIDNMKFYILDKQGHRMPFGAAGELCIAGRQVGLGYRGLPEKTASVFCKNPFTDDPAYARLYHTGDIVRELPDGNYDFVGRKDGQIKIRGFRVELTEIEHVIRDYEGVENAVVAAFDDPAGGKYLAAYVVSGKTLDFDDLGRFIGARKPSYMIPAAFMQLDRIPLTVNGKVDKRALPEPVRTASRTGAAPANEDEQTFCRIFSEVLGTEPVYADDDFFAIGGTSISAAQAVVKCDAAGYSIVFKNFFEHSTPQSLAAFVRSGGDADILAPAGEEKEHFDDSCLAYNVIANLPNIRNDGVGDVLLTGVTGYLGSHLYRALIDGTDGRVICCVRGKNGMSGEDRFRTIMTYYFEDWFDEHCEARTEVVEGDLEDESIADKLESLRFDTIINSAANVKHFAKTEDLIRANYESVEHLIALAEKKNAKLIQTSSLSVCGESVNGSIPMDFLFREYNLNIGQSLENKYVYSKYLAEQSIIDAVSRGRIRGKIIRLGNLAAREEDGEFQINSSNSGLMKLMQGYLKLGCYPIDMMDATIEFSPIDKVAEATILLAGTPDPFTVFHAKNCHAIHYGYLIHALKQRGHQIDIVEPAEFEERFKRALENEEDLEDYTAFIAYLNRTDDSVTDLMKYNDDDSNQSKDAPSRTYETRVKVASDTAFTTKALYRLGFAWPLTSREYLDQMIRALDDKLFF